MKRYPEYNESDVEWIGEIPVHLEVKRLKYVADLIMGQSPPSEQYSSDHVGTPFLQGNAEFGAQHPTPKIYCPSAKKHAKPGDILLSVRAPVGAINIADQDYGIGRGLCAIRPWGTQLEHHFAKYLLEVVRAELHVVATGSTYDAVTVDDVSNLTCVVPPLSEQTQIANFLDRKTAQIDELIRGKERRIELLREQRTALINQAVTNGLDPNVEMKPSGVEWVNQIPEHWEVVKFRRLSYESRMKNDDDVDRKMLSLSSYTGVQVKQYQYENTKRSKEESLTYLVVEPNQLVVNPMWQIQGGIGVSYLHGIVSPGYRVYYIDLEKLIPQYLHLLMRSDIYVDEYNKHIRGLTTYDRSVRKEDFEEIGVLLPPMQEQTQIANFLDRKTKQIDKLISAEERKIELLKEYRQSLISDAVTGKIDVRNEV